MWQSPHRPDTPLELTFRPATAPIDAPVAKLGGRPFWLDEPLWPVSAESGLPMTFVGQFPLPGPAPRMSYLFITQDDASMAPTFEPEAGENALLVQPGGRVPAFVTGLRQPTGPSLWRRGATWTDRVPVELHVDARPFTGASLSLYHREIDTQEAALRGDTADDGSGNGLLRRSYAGGKPLFWQPWTTVIDPAWQFFFQLDGAEGCDEDAYALNFGGGTGYALLSEDQREGRFFWDCV
ncbi:hypothetical protein ACFO1B_01960 [Dactylosporangium siamense]|uniref:DUF1963 domain-containing protein n=1 Tax=Dactylosporangium siamense TaxID=685454 RepID=A0A919UDY0_9ACTN|nr:hypothetical protein [Dactylosporangium siamense]GIG48431.1 hypothetical protein Dsi01nite_064720 [Dactylosporangium siamense]